MSEVRVEVRDARGAPRCPFCHEDCHDLVAVALWTCDLCGVMLHDDCRMALGGCATLGCAHLAPRAKGDPRGWPAILRAIREAEAQAPVIPERWAREATLPSGPALVRALGLLGAMGLGLVGTIGIVVVITSLRWALTSPLSYALAIAGCLVVAIGGFVTAWWLANRPPPP